LRSEFRFVAGFWQSLSATIHEQKVRCGKPNCKCSRGESHTAFYRFWRDEREQSAGLRQMIIN